MRFGIVFKTFVKIFFDEKFCLLTFVTSYWFQGHLLYYLPKVEALPQRVPEHLNVKTFLANLLIDCGYLRKDACRLWCSKDSDLASHLLARDHTEFE